MGVNPLCCHQPESPDAYCMVQDEKGTKRVVHRNLLLNISFLPIQTELGRASNPYLNDCDDDGESVAHLQPQDSADCLEGESSERRTSLWVIDETEHSLSQSLQSETGSVQFHTEGEQQSQDGDCSEKLCDDDDSHITEPFNDQTDCFSLDCDRANPRVEERDMPNTEQPSSDTRDRDTQGVENTQEQVTRAGRVVKKVNHLIESMTQRQLKIKSLTNTLSRKSQSLLTLF